MPAIDGLRAIAVLAVVFYHASPHRLPGGFVGVDIFFVISGYLISRNIFAGIDQQKFSFIRFYAHRVGRIFPALATMLVAVLVAGWFLLLTDEYTELGKHVAASAAFASNLALWAEHGYFDTASAAKPLLHLWSLGIEEQFYIIWPLLIVAARKAGLNWWWALGGIAAVSFAANIHYTAIDPVQGFYSPLPRFWELATGGLLALTARDYPAVFRLLSGRTAALLGALMVAAGLWFIREGSGFPGWWATLPVIGSALLIASSPKVLSQRGLVGIGLISYPLYLWHWPILSFIFIIEGHAGSRHLRIVAVALSLALAWVTWRFIERPLRFTIRIKPLPLVAWLAAAGVVGAAVFVTNGFEPVRTELVAGVGDIGPSLEWPYASTPGCNERYVFDALDDVAFWFCGTNRLEPPTVITLGNSYANDIFPGLAERLPEETVLSIGACVPLLRVRLVDKNRMVGHPCTLENQKANDLFVSDVIAKNPTIRVAILHAAWPHLDQDGSTPDVGVFVSDEDPAASSADAFLAGIRNRIEFLKQHRIRVVLVLPRPQPGYDIRTCFSRPLTNAANTCVVDAKSWYERDAILRNGLLNLAKNDPLIEVFDPYEVFCRQFICNFVRDGKPLLRDDSGHLSKFGSGVLAESLIRRFDAL